MIDLEITANRPDALSVFGIAREVAAALRLPLTPPEGADPADSCYDLPAPADDGPYSTAEGRRGTTAKGRHGSTVEGRAKTQLPGLNLAISVDLEDAERCPRYVAATMPVRVGPSPAWLADRLRAAGVRPINNVVDVSNYVMIEMGHPTHAFDLARLGGRTLHIRRARSGERLMTLDGMTRTLDEDILVIADADRAQAVAGVMGGGDSEVGDTTTAIALESAYFHPPSVRRASKRLALKTEASARFERGASPAAPPMAVERAWRLLADMGAAGPIDLLVDRFPAPRPRRVVTLRRTRIAHLLDVDVPAAQVTEILSRLGFGTDPGEDTRDGLEAWNVTVPPWRVDVTREADLIEEVARHVGYDRIPNTFPSLAVPPPAPDPKRVQTALVRQLLTAAGFSEATTFTFIERAAAAAFADDADLVALANPLSEKFAVLRPSAVIGLLESAAHNRRRGREQVRLFEIGRRFTRAEGERRAAAALWVGSGLEPHWSARPRPVDFFDVKGVVERLGEAFGLSLTWTPTALRAFVEGRCAAVTVADGSGTWHRVAVLGQLDPAVTSARGLPDGDEAYAVEIDLDVLAAVAPRREVEHAVTPSRYPAVVRDLSIIVSDTLPALTVRGTIQAAAPPTLAAVREFDRYKGTGVPEGRVSLSLHLVFQAADRTLTDDEVEEAMAAVVDALAAAHGAMRR